MINTLRIGFAALFVAVGAVLLSVVAVAYQYLVAGLCALCMAFPFLCAWNIGPAAFGAPKATYWSAFGVCFLLFLFKHWLQERKIKVSFGK